VAEIEADDSISGGRLSQRRDAATGNKRRPTKARQNARTCSWCDEDECRQIVAVVKHEHNIYWHSLQATTTLLEH